MSDDFRFETFVDAHGSIFNEYLSSIIAKPQRENEEYHAVQAKIESLHEKYLKTLGVFDSEQVTKLTKEECVFLIKVLEFKNQLTNTELQSIYFRGCYDSVGYLKNTGILYRSDREKAALA